MAPCRWITPYKRNGEAMAIGRSIAVEVIMVGEAVSRGKDPKEDVPPQI
jgi:hypothetical protein